MGRLDVGTSMGYHSASLLSAGRIIRSILSTPGLDFFGSISLTCVLDGAIFSFRKGWRAGTNTGTDTCVPENENPNDYICKYDQEGLIQSGINSEGFLMMSWFDDVSLTPEASLKTLRLEKWFYYCWSDELLAKYIAGEPLKSRFMREKCRRMQNGPFPIPWECKAISELKAIE